MDHDGGLSPEHITGLSSGDRTSVRAAIAGLPRDDLADWLRTTDGEAMLRDAFVRMPRYFVSGVLDRVQTVRWRVQRPPAAQVEYDLVVDPQDCVVRPVEDDTSPDVTLIVDAVSFVELASAARPGMDLLLHGDLHVQGDVQLAMRLESLFGLGQETERP